MQTLGQILNSPSPPNSSKFSDAWRSGTYRASRGLYRRAADRMTLQAVDILWVCRLDVSISGRSALLR
jgi:hypothetical protein